MVRKLMMMVAAAGMVLAPVASANAASSLSVARSMAPVSGASYLQDDDDDDDGSTAIILGLVLIVLFVAIVVGGNRSEPSNSP